MTEPTNAELAERAVAALYPALFAGEDSYRAAQKAVRYALREQEGEKVTNGQIDGEHYTPAADDARSIASYVDDPKQRKNVYDRARQIIAPLREQSPPPTVKDAFFDAEDQDAVADWAEKHGASLVWANDPDGFMHLIGFTSPTRIAALEAFAAIAPPTVEADAVKGAPVRGDIREKVIHALRKKATEIDHRPGVRSNDVAWFAEEYADAVLSLIKEG